MDLCGSFSQGMDLGGTISLSRPDLGRDHLSLRRHYRTLKQDNLIMDVLSLALGHLSMCTLSAGRVQVSSCDPGHLLNYLSRGSMH